MNALFNLARVTTPTTGTGPISLGTAVPGYLTFDEADAPDGATVSYGIFDGANSEAGWGVYDASGLTLTRNVYRSTGAANTGLISLSGNAQVFITALAEDFDSLVATPYLPLAGGHLSGELFLDLLPLAINEGGTGARTAAAALSSLGAYPASNPSGYINANQTITVSGDASGSGSTAITLTLPTINSNVGTFAIQTVNAKGQVTAAANMTGDVTTSGAAATLATVNSNVGTFQGLTLDAKGRVTAAVNQGYVTGGPYLPTAGGTLTGTLIMGGTSQGINYSSLGTDGNHNFGFAWAPGSILKAYVDTIFVGNVTFGGPYLPLAGGQLSGPLAINRTIPSGGNIGNLYANGALTTGWVGFNAYLNAAVSGWLHLTGTDTSAVFTYEPGTNNYVWYVGPNASAGSTTTQTAVATLSSTGSLNLLSGSNNGLFVQDSSTSGAGGFYRTGGITRLWDGVGGDVIQYNASHVGIFMAPNASYALAVTGPVYCSGILNANGGLYAGGYPVLGAGSIYTVLTDPSGSNRLYLGNAVDPSTYIRNTTINLQDAAGTTGFLTANVNGISTPGAVAIGAAVPGHVSLYMNTNLDGSSNFPIYLQNTGGYAFLYIRADAAIAYVGVTAWTYASDRREKIDIVAISPKEALENLLSFRPASFTMKETGEKSFGLVAQDVQPIYPELVNIAHATRHAPDGMLGLKYNGLHGIEIAAIQELARRVSALEGRT